MLIECFEQVKLGILLDLYTKVVQLLDRCITCQEVQRTRAKADDLQILQTNDSACNRNELMNHICALCSGSYRILRNICMDIAQLQVVACVQHTAVSIATAIA